MNILNTDHSSTIRSHKRSLGEITTRGLFFNVPIYQRPYVWGEEQVKTLMSDLCTAAEHEEDFHLGGVLVVKNGDCYDLIDGQQRFTTLWLIANELKKMKKPCDNLMKFRGDAGKLRVHFSIRDHINTYFENDVVAEHEDLIPILQAEKWIQAQIESSDIDDFAAFLYKCVKLIVTVVPPKTDLNKLFEVINNRGVQLEQHEILKAKILKPINDIGERTKYAALWNACADMNNYLEKSARESFDLMAKDMIQLKDDLGCSKKSWKKKGDIERKQQLALNNQTNGTQLTSNSNESGLSGGNLLDILESEPKMLNKVRSNEDGSEYTHVRSIVSFPLFLLHVLRVYLFKEKEQEFLGNNYEKLDVRRHVSDKKLIQLFEANLLNKFDVDKAKDFIELLWQLRWAFDSHVVKWVKSDESPDEFLCIGQLESFKNKGDEYFRRKFIDAKSRLDDMSMLQSMLYHSQELTTQHWLTPLLHQMMTCDDRENLTSYLKKLDNQLIWVKNEGKKSLAERAWSAMEGTLGRGTPDWNILDSNKGTEFPHYWFYKLEFVLWLSKAGLFEDVNIKEKFKFYRITSKNSVEHVSAQTDREDEGGKDRVSEGNRDYFGNLALVSREFNSSAGNQSVKVKGDNFYEKKKLESLKLALIYKEETWGDDKAKDHQALMKELLTKYLTETE